MKRRWPPTFWFAFGDRGVELRERHAVPAQAVGVDLDVVLLRLAAVARDVDDALHLLELALEDPVLGRLQVLERVALARRRGSGRPRRSRSRARAAPAAPLGSCTNWMRLMTSCRASLYSVAPLEVALDVAQARRATASACGRGPACPTRPISSGIVTYRSISSALQPVRLRDHLDQRRDRVRVRLDVELRVGGQPAENDDDGHREDDDGHPQRERDELLDHSVLDGETRRGAESNSRAPTPHGGRSSTMAPRRAKSSRRPRLQFARGARQTASSGRDR